MTRLDEHLDLGEARHLGHANAGVAHIEDGFGRGELGVVEAHPLNGGSVGRSGVADAPRILLFQEMKVEP